jgi:hypothetical protein
MFCQWLSPVLREHLMLFRGCTLNEFVSASIEQEDACRSHIEEERKKRPLSRPNGRVSPKYHLVYTPSGQPRVPPPPQQWSHRPPQLMAPRPPVYPQQVAPARALQPTGVGFSCFNRGRTGHFARQCS